MAHFFISSLSAEGNIFSSLTENVVYLLIQYVFEWIRRLLLCVQEVVAHFVKSVTENVAYLFNFSGSSYFLYTKFSEEKKIHGKVTPKLGIYRWVSGFGQGERFLVKK